MDPLKLRRFCENECVTEDGQLKHRATGKTVKAIVVVHVFGNMADMEAIMDIAQEFHLKVIEDATEALGTQYTKGRYAGKFAGTIGDFGAYSFNGNKIITTGGGGAVTAKDPTEVEHLKYLSTQAKDDPHFYIHNEVGYNYRMTNLQAALGVAQMEELPEFIHRKQKNYGLYQQLLQEFSGGTLLFPCPLLPVCLPCTTVRLHNPQTDFPVRLILQATLPLLQSLRNPVLSQTPRLTFGSPV